MKGRDRTRCAICLWLFACLTFGSILLLNLTENSFLLSLLRSTVLELDYTPRAFESFHLQCLAACVILTVAVGRIAWRIPEERLDRVTDLTVFSVGLLFLALEVYKQLFATFVVGNGGYDYSIFPFQFCSLPLYICPIVPFFHSRRVKRSFYCFLALFATVGGYIVLGYPRFSPHFTLCIHTMLWHAIMVVLGVFLLISQRIGERLKQDLLPAASIFGGSMVLATVLNVVLQERAIATGSALNLFYLSPYGETNFLVIRQVRAVLGWFPAVVTYAALFCVAGALPLWLLGRFFTKFRKKQKK